MFIDENIKRLFDAEDLKNFSYMPKDANDRTSTLTARRIRHNKFGNANCASALKSLSKQPNGDFMFRPSR